jgi:signal transduction histidine kinase/CheY-like chemotaxis protein
MRYKEETVNNTYAVDFESDFRISSSPLMVTMFVTGMVIVYLAGLPGTIFHRITLLGLGCLLLALIPVLAYFETRRLLIGRWAALLVLAAGLDVSSAWFDAHVSLILAPIVIAFAVAVVDFRFGFFLALVQTVFVLSMNHAFKLEIAPSTAIIAILALWASYSMTLLMYYPVWRVGQWMQQYYDQTRKLADDTQRHREEHEQLVKDLAHANLQMSRLNDLAQGLRQSAEAARTAKEQFVANVSHELRTPLNMIIGFSEMILQTPDMYGGVIPSKLLADLAVIYRNAEHLADLINDVLDLSQIEADQMALAKEYVQFPEIVKTAAQVVRPLYESKGLYLKVDMPDTLPVVFCDPTRMREVLLNLLSNAGRFTELGGVLLSVRCEANEIVVAVSDTGHGIAASDIGKLFQPFQQLDGTVRRLYGGTGLGLSISKRFIELHDGTISVQSQEGSGTIFTFRLPVIPPAPLVGDSGRWLIPDWTFLQRTEPSLAPRPVVRPRLLVLENGEILRHLLVRYMDGVEISPIFSVEQAVDELQHTPAQALIINSPSIVKGLDLLKVSAPLPTGVPVLVCVMPDPHDPQASMGVSDILVKPISHDALLGALEKLGITQGTVLVVDDEPDGLQLFGRMLASSPYSYRVLLAGDGLEAMAILEETCPDVIMLDLVMPNMDGFQLLTRLRESPRLRDIPTIIISARDPSGQPIMCSSFAVVQTSGISTRQLLACVRAMTQILSPIPGGGPKQQAIPNA